MSSMPLSDLNLFTDLKFEKRNIIFLDSPFSFFEFTVNFLSLQKYFSFNVSTDPSSKPAFLQIATIEFIFILDLKKLKQILEKYKKIEWFFSQLDQILQSQVLKISFGIGNALATISVLFPGFFSFPMNIIDFKDFCRVRNLDISNTPYYNDVLNFHKRFSTDTPAQSVENLALYPYLILLMYVNVVEESNDKMHKNQVELTRCVSLTEDLKFKGSIAFINENNVDQIQTMFNSLKAQGILALDGVSCPKDQVMDIFLIASFDSIFIIDIKSIKKKIFVNSRKSKGELDSAKIEQIKTIFLNQLNEILQKDSILKVSFDFNHDFRCLKNRFNKDIACLNNLLNLKFYHKILNCTENSSVNEVIFSLFKRELPIEENVDSKQMFLHPLSVYGLATRVYSLLELFKRKFSKSAYSTENLSLQNLTPNNKKESKAKGSPISPDYEIYYSNMAYPTTYPNYYPFSQTLLIPEFMNLNLSEDFISLKDLNFDESRIYLIDRIDEKFFGSLQKIKKSRVIGVDSEWHPNERVTAIFQVATEDDIFIFDICGFKRNDKLESSMGNPDDQLLRFYQGINEILTSDEILKISFDFNHDRINLINVHQIFENEFNKILDFVYYRMSILGQNKGGLKDLVYRVYNKTMCKSKSMVLSDWKQRPLLENQIKYAALDAYIVLQIYLKIKENLFFGV